MKQMSKKKFRIGELAKVLQVKKFVIRFWEKEFELKSDRSQGGQRYYTQDDFKAFNTIKFLLYKQGFTIAGAKIQLEKMLIKHKGSLPQEPLLMEPSSTELSLTDSSQPKIENTQITAATKTIEKPVPYVPEELLERIKSFKKKLLELEEQL